MAQFARAPFESPRRTIDVSGDGTNNAGRDVTLARDEAVAKGITINGLVILSATPLPWNPDHTNPPGGLEHYYRNNVVGGPGAFVHGGQGLQLVRRGDHREDDRRGGAGAGTGAAAGRGGPVNRFHLFVRSCGEWWRKSDGPDAHGGSGLGRD